MNKLTRITTLEFSILRDEGRGKTSTFIYTVPKINKVKAYCKLGKLEDIMEEFNISSIDQLINILEAWEITKTDSVLSILLKDLANGESLNYHRLSKENQETLKKALEVKDENRNS